MVELLDCSYCCVKPCFCGRRRNGFAFQKFCCADAETVAGYTRDRAMTGTGADGCRRWRGRTIRCHATKEAKEKKFQSAVRLIGFLFINSPPLSSSSSFSSCSTRPRSFPSDLPCVCVQEQQLRCERLYSIGIDSFNALPAFCVLCLLFSALRCAAHTHENSSRLLHRASDRLTVKTRSHHANRPFTLCLVFKIALRSLAAINKHQNY